MTSSLVPARQAHHPVYVMAARAGRVAAVVVLAGAVAYLLIGAVLASQLTEPKRQAQVVSVASVVEREDVRVRSRDGLNLAGWFITAPGSARAMLMVHGRNSCRSCEFDGRFVELAGQLQSAGYNILMIDLRGHGQSEGTHYTFGEEERWDVLGALDWLHERGFTQVGVLGVSLGALSTVRAALEPDGARGIHAMVLDSCFGDFDAVLQHGFTRETGYPDWILPGGLLMTRLLYGVNLEAAKPIDELPRTTAPLMLIFSQQDQYITPEQMQLMSAARADAQLWTVPDGEHARIYNNHPQEYAARVVRFLDERLR